VSAVPTGTQHDGRSTVWLAKEGVAFLKSIAVVRGDETLGDTMTTILDHYRTCQHGLVVDLKDAQKRLETLKQFKLVAAVD